jgi:hypothetical protein
MSKEAFSELCAYIGQFLFYLFIGLFNDAFIGSKEIM